MDFGCRVLLLLPIHSYAIETFCMSACSVKRPIKRYGWLHQILQLIFTKSTKCRPLLFCRFIFQNDLPYMSSFHLYPPTAEANCTQSLDAPLWVALAIVQSYSRRRKVPRSEISIPDLELCLSKAAFSAAQHSGSVPFWFLDIKLFTNLEHIF